MRRILNFIGRVSAAFVLVFGICSCGGGGGGGSGSGAGRSAGLEAANFDCDGACTNQFLSEADVTRILQQAVYGAQTLGLAGTFAVLDRVGNVLAVYQMAGAPATTTIDGQIGASGGLESVTVPATLAAISKAGTGAYLSSQGNAFSSRTASQIVQEHFNPGEENQPGGPLFGVQFSQLICSDVTVFNAAFGGGISSGSKATNSARVGPRPLPLGLSADPGGIPLYKQGDIVGGLGVEFDGSYRLDRDIVDYDQDFEERVALMASSGYEFPSDRSGDRLFVVGKSLRTADLRYQDLEEIPAELPGLDGSGLAAVSLYTDGTIRSGAIFGDPESGVAETVRAGVPAAFLVDGSGAARFPTRAGTALPGGAELTAAEVDAILDSALVTAFRERAAIRRPLDTAARVSIWVVDSAGIPLGMTRSQDAPVFGLDVALQKARSAAFFSLSNAGDLLDQVRARNGFGAFDDYVSAIRATIGSTALTGTHAITNRAVGNLARPFLPDGIDINSNGPLSHPFPGTSVASRSWSPFNTGLQLDLIFQRLAQPLGLPVSPPSAIPDSCTDSGVLGSRLRNGIQIFPGSVPLYRGATLVGAIGVSGDGIDQDDFVAFFGASRQGLDYVGHTGIGDPQYGFNAPREIRSDNIEVPAANVRLRYVNCPESPFRDSDEQRVCENL